MVERVWVGARGKSSSSGSGQESGSSPSYGSCISGDMSVCDEYYLNSAPGSEDKFIGQTCGYRDYDSSGNECVRLHGRFYSDN